MMKNMIRLFCVAYAALLTTTVVAQDFSLQNTVQLVPDKDTTLLQFKVPLEAQNGLIKVCVFVSYNNIYATLPYVYAPGVEQQPMTVSVDDEGSATYLFRDPKSHLPGKHGYKIALLYDSTANSAIVEYVVKEKNRLLKM